MCVVSSPIVTLNSESAHGTQQNKILHYFPVPITKPITRDKIDYRRAQLSL